MWTRTKFAASALPVLLLGATAWIYPRQSTKLESEFETEKVSRSRIVGKVSSTGTLSALVTVQVGTQVSGRIDKLHADFNSTVLKGELLAEIDPLLFQAAVKNAVASLEQNRGLVRQARIKAEVDRKAFEREKALFLQQLVSQQDLDNADALADEDDAALEAAQGVLDQAKAALDTAKLNLFYTKITSPISGTVISRAVDVGQTVAASLSAPTLFTIAEDLTKIQVDTSVAEADVGRLTQGMPAAFFVDAYPGQAFLGTVRQVRFNSTTVQNIVTYDAVVDVANPEKKLMPGMTATVTFVYADREVLSVPNAAFRFQPAADRVLTPGLADLNSAVATADTSTAQRSDATRSPLLPPDQSERKIYIPDGTGKRLRPLTIRTGITDGTRTEILDGPAIAGLDVATAMHNKTSSTNAQTRMPRGMGMPPPP